MHATDASFWGRGVVSAQREVEEIRAVAADCDRWRFNAEDEQAVKHLEEHMPMQSWSVETLEPDEAMPSLKPDGDLDGVREVPLGFIGEDWSKVDSCKWNRVEGIPTLEGRAVVWVLQHLGRSSKNLGCRHLILSDSMSVVLALSKGRSSTRPMNRICRQVAALEFITGMQLSVRWVPSEVNPADQPSRAQDLKGFNLKAGVQKLREGHVEKAGRVHKSHWRESALQGYEKELGLSPRSQVGFARSSRGEGGQGQDESPEGESPTPSTSSREVPKFGDRRRQDLFGDQVHHSGSGEKLCQGVPKLLCLGQGEPHQCHHGGEDRSDVLRWPRPSRWSNVDGIGEVLPAGRGQAGAVGEVLQCNEGFQEAGASSGQTPIALPMLCAVVKELWHRAKKISLWLLVVWATCCRPGEALKLRKKDLVGPSRMCGHWIIILNPGKDNPGVRTNKHYQQPRKRDAEGEIKMTSKVGESDEALIIDQPYLKGLGQLLHIYLKDKHMDDLMFNISIAEAASQFGKVVKMLGYDQIGIVCSYQIRHGSASTDVLQGLRGLPEVQKRGRWNVAKSVRRYTNGGRLAQVFASLSPPQKQGAIAAEKWMSKILDVGIWSGSVMGDV